MESSPITDIQVEGAEQPEPGEHDPAYDPDLDPATYAFRLPAIGEHADPAARSPFPFGPQSGLPGAGE